MTAWARAGARLFYGLLLSVFRSDLVEAFAFVTMGASRLANVNEPGDRWQEKIAPTSDRLDHPPVAASVPYQASETSSSVQ